jgi:hypothetical protein
MAWGVPVSGLAIVMVAVTLAYLPRAERRIAADLRL